jgi:Flp pilus assembly pilin Flp
MIRTLAARLRRETRGAASLEFALLASGILLPLTFAIIGAGGILWTQSSLQSTAVLAARCGAIGSPQCSGGVSGIQSYAVSTANNWIVPGVITTADVLVNGASVNCSAVAGNVEIVEISTSYFSATLLPPPFGGKVIDVCGYYPKCATC